MRSSLFSNTYWRSNPNARDVLRRRIIGNRLTHGFIPRFIDWDQSFHHSWCGNTRRVVFPIAHLNRTIGRPDRSRVTTTQVIPHLVNGQHRRSDLEPVLVLANKDRDRHTFPSKRRTVFSNLFISSRWLSSLAVLRSTLPSMRSMSSLHSAKVSSNFLKCLIPSAISAAKVFSDSAT